MAKIALQILCFDGLKYLRPLLECHGMFVDRIYLLHSSQPWNKKESFDSEIKSSHLVNLPYNDKIFVIEGIYSTEEEQRNEALQMARNEGFDIMIIQDLDEFYLPEVYTSLINTALQFPDFHYYRCPWILFWKDYHHVIEFAQVDGKRAKTIYNFNPCFAVNLKHSEIKFRQNRLLNTLHFKMLEGLCYHFSYVLDDVAIRKKLATWGHASQVKSLNLWYQCKWLNWHTNVKNINPISPLSWRRAIVFNQVNVIKQFGLSEVSFKTEHSPFWKVINFVYDSYFTITFNLKSLVRKMIQKV